MDLCDKLLRTRRRRQHLLVPMVALWLGAAGRKSTE